MTVLKKNILRDTPNERCINNIYIKSMRLSFFVSSNACIILKERNNEEIINAKITEDQATVVEGIAHKITEKRNEVPE